MGKFYIETTEVGLSGKYLLFELSATTDVAINNSSTITQYPIENGTQVVDHIVSNPVSVSLSGIITDIASLSIGEGVSREFRTGDGKDDVRKFIEQLEAKISDRETFSVYFSSVLKPVRNCLITNFSYSKNNTIGGESWLISLELQQIRFANRAQFVLKPNANWSALVAQPKKAASTKASCDSSTTNAVNASLSDESKTENASLKLTVGSNTIFGNDNAAPAAANPVKANQKVVYQQLKGLGG